MTGKLDAFLRVRERSVHFTIEQSDADDFKRLGLTAHTVSHMNTLGSVEVDRAPACVRDLAFIGHAVPPIWSPVPFGAERDADYFQSYLARVKRLDHRIKEDFGAPAGVATAADIAAKMQYVQHVHLYSQPHRGAVLEKIGGHGLHIYGGDPSWIHGIDQSRFLSNPNITYYPPVFEVAQVVELFSTTRININVTSLQFDSAVINRVMDCAAAGGFMLTDRKEQLYSLTSVADEISYGTIEELTEKIDYFMSPEHEGRRVEIGRQLRQELGERCSVERCAENMLSKLSGI